MTMKSSRHWLAGSVLGLAVAGAVLIQGGLAQPPGPDTPPPWAVPSPGSGRLDTPPAGRSPAPAPTPGLPDPRVAGSGIKQQGDLLRYSHNVPGDAKPIILEADQVFTWQEDGRLAFLLAGRVLVQQGAVQSRSELAAGWIDLARHRQTGVLHLDLYAEGKVRLDTSIDVQDGARAALDFNTRGEFRVRAGRGKVQRQDRAGEPIVLRARGVYPGKGGATTAAPPEPSPIKPVGGEASPPPPPGSPTPPEVKPASGGAGPMSFDKRQPGPSGPAASPIQLVQATEPAPPPQVGPPAPPAGPPRSMMPPGRTTLPGAPPLPPPPDSRDLPKSESQRQPDADTAPQPDLLPPPIPGVPGPRGTLPPPDPEPDADLPPAPALPTYPPPSQPAQPPRPGELPPTSSPGQPLVHRLLPRSAKEPHLKIDTLPSGMKIITATGGLILNVRNVPRLGVLDVEADRAVVWVKDNDANKVAGNLRSDRGEASTDLEFYMAGHVILRSQQGNGTDRTALEADELYYDARRNVAVALDARLQVKTNKLSQGSTQFTEPLILKAPELFRTGPNTFAVREAQISASKLASDPGLKLLVSEATLTNRSYQRTNWFGTPVFDKKTGKPVMIDESILEASNVVTELEGVPVFYTPYLVTDARNPLGPLETITFGVNRIYGFQGGVGLNVYKLLGLMPVEGTRWRLLLDYLSRRGPAAGTNFDYLGKFDSLMDDPQMEDPPRYDGAVRMFGLHDKATDILGGDRPYLTFHPPGWRGRALWRQGLYDLPEGFNVQSQVSLLSDRNFLEQYFKREFDTDPNQANFLYVKQQQDNWAWSAMGQIRQADWITTTEWLPRVDGYLLGQDLFERVTSNTWVDLAFARLKPSSDPPIPLQGVAVQPPGWPLIADPTTQPANTGRLALWQEFSLPLDLGPVKFVPYAKGVLAEYTSDLRGDQTGRAWGGVGARASLPLSALYPDVSNELFNLKGLNHKMVFSANYFVAAANESYLDFPQLDRLNDDATASALREIKPQEPLFNKSAGVALATSPLFDPQRYAIRRLVDNRLETLDDIQVLQLDLRQRLQTKRGYPGAEHIIDWMVLDTSVSLFPAADRDNFGKGYSFLEYNYLWNIGDRTAIDSYGWFDPQENGPKVWTVGAYFNRPDRTSFYLGYRQIDPLHSRVVTGSMSYLFSPKYSMTLTASYDLGTTEAITNTVVFTRTGTDLQVSLGFMYNSLQNNVGAIVEIVPNLLPMNRRGGGLGMGGMTGGLASGSGAYGSSGSGLTNR